MVIVRDKKQTYEEYLKDESGLKGWSDLFYFPENVNDLKDIIKNLCSKKEKITVQGNRTGISGGAVPRGGAVITTQKLNRVLEFEFDADKKEGYLTLEAGVTLEEITKGLKAKRFDTSLWSEKSKLHLENYRHSDILLFFPPNPTETTATIGGMTACNTSGSNAYGYGKLNNYIESIEIILGEATVLLDRKETEYNSIQQKMLYGHKNDLKYDHIIDIFCGSEGYLGVISQVKIKLMYQPAHSWGVLLPFEDAEIMINFVKDIEDEEVTCIKSIDLFNSHTIHIINAFKTTVTSFADLPHMNMDKPFYMYLEISHDSEDMLIQSLEAIHKHLDIYAEDALVATSPNELARFKKIWHCAIECIEMMPKNITIDIPGLDVIVPMSIYEEILGMMAKDIHKKDIQMMMLSHIGIGHINVRLFPKDKEEKTMANEILQKWLMHIKQCECQYAGEFGTGVLNAKIA